MSREERLAVLARIAECEKEGKFNADVEDDPPAEPILPGQVDYQTKKLSSRVAGVLSSGAADLFYRNLIAKKQFILKEPQGKENLSLVKSGAVITCNHFNLADNYAIYRAVRSILPRRLRLYRVIREGNYSFSGFFGYLFKNCYTLPIPSDIHVLREMTEGVNALLQKGEKILIYPEQSMWWNYRKPRPYMSGAFTFAARAGVPILPCFISLQDHPTWLDADGFPVQEYTVHILPPIYPDPSKTVRENARRMAEENAATVLAKYRECYKGS